MKLNKEIISLITNFRRFYSLQDERKKFAFLTTHIFQNLLKKYQKNKNSIDSLKYITQREVQMCLMENWKKKKCLQENKNSVYYGKKRNEAVLEKEADKVKETILGSKELDK